MASAADRFRAKVAIDDTGCHLWTAATDKDGYGQFNDGGTRQAHIWAWEQANGGDRLPEGYELDHLCRKYNCVNPEHLELVTHAENMRRQREASKRKKRNAKILPLKRRKFIEAYLGEANGNATEAARVAGYAEPKQEGSRLLSFADVRQEIDKRLSGDPMIKTREQVLRWISEKMDNAEDERNSVKCAEMLAKAHGCFVQRVEHSGPGGNPIEVSSDHAAAVRRILSDETARESILQAVGVLNAGVGPGTA